MKKVFLENLPKNKNGTICWKDSVGYKIKFIYNDLEGEITILKYIYHPKMPEVQLKYKNNIEIIKTQSLKKCFIRKLIGYEETVNFKIPLQTVFKDSKRNITIINKRVSYRTQINKKCKNGIGNHYIKEYEYCCNICSYKGWDTEEHILEGRGCACCASKKVTNNNCIHFKRPDIEIYLDKKSDAYLYTPGSHKYVLCQCPFCKSKKNIQVKNLCKYGFICNECSDHISFSEKAMMYVLKSLNIDFITQLSSYNFKWCGKYKYDFYLPDYNTIIEVHGCQHYLGGFGVPAEDIMKNDNNKMVLAKKYVSNYIVIDSRLGTLDYFKDSLINNSFFKNFNLSKINWIDCLKFCNKSLLIDVCKYYEYMKNNNKKTTVAEVSRVFKIKVSTGYNFIQTGKKLGIIKII